MNNYVVQILIEEYVEAETYLDAVFRFVNTYSPGTNVRVESVSQILGYENEEPVLDNLWKRSEVKKY